MWTTPLRQGKSIISKHNLNGIDQILWTIIDDDLDHEFLGGQKNADLLWNIYQPSKCIKMEATSCEASIELALFVINNIKAMFRTSKHPNVFYSTIYLNYAISSIMKKTSRQ